MTIGTDGIVTVINNRRGILRATTDGGFITEWSNLIRGPAAQRDNTGITTDTAGNVFVADASSIKMYSSDGQFLDEIAEPFDSFPIFPKRVGPSDIEVSSDGSLFILDQDSDRVVKFDSSYVYELEWGTSGSGPGQFLLAWGIAIDDRVGGTGYVYVTDHDPAAQGVARVQVFEQDGTYVGEFGSRGGTNGDFFSPRDLVIDSNGRIYVVDSGKNFLQVFTYDDVNIEWNLDDTWELGLSSMIDVAIDEFDNIYVLTLFGDYHVHKFSPQGSFLTGFSPEGHDAGQSLRPNGISIGPLGEVYVSDTDHLRTLKFTPVTLSENAKAIVVAGGGAFPGNDLWDATQASANFAYRALQYQGFTKETIYYLSSDTDLDLDGNGLADDVDADATNANLQFALEQWATQKLGSLPTGDVVVYLCDHGGVDTFRMGELETLSEGSLNTWLTTAQNHPDVTGEMTVVYDACESGTFQDALAAVGRTVITSTSPGEAAYFLNTGTISFSNFFWTQVFNGESVVDSFNFATSAVGQTLGAQNPQLNSDGNTTPNEAADFTTVSGLFIGNATDFFQGRPTIGSVSATPNPILNGNTATLQAFTVEDSDNPTDPNAIARVWAVIRPPDFIPSDTTNPIQSLPSVDLNRVSAGSFNFAVSYDGFTSIGPYQIAIYALDDNGNVSAPSPLTVNVSNPRKRRAIIVAGGSPANAQWPAYEKSYAEAYKALRTQGYADSELYVMAHTTVVPHQVNLPTVGNLENDALGTFVGSDTHDLVLYMVGPGGDDLFQMSASENLSASLQLAGWLNTVEAAITGTMSVVYDACNAGSFLSPLAAPGRIIIASTTASDSARFLRDGDVCFSNFFWSQVLNGASVEKAFLRAKQSMAFAGNGQDAQLDDTGNGIGNEAQDGQIARHYFFGHGFVLAGDEPVIGSATPGVALNGASSQLLWADSVTTTGGISAVWAAITPPGFDPGNCAPLVPTVLLAPGGGGHDYGGTYNGFTKVGDYTVSFYAMDVDGDISIAKESVFSQNVALDNTPPVVSVFTPPNGSTGVALQPVFSFVVTDAGSGVDINSVSLSLNGIDVSQQLTIIGLPSNYNVTYVPPVPFALGQIILARVSTSDLDGNAAGPFTYSFTVTDGVDSDMNGLPDDWESYYGLTNPTGDADGDGYTNEDEAAQGTDPLVANSVPSGPDSYENDDTPATASWLNVDDPVQFHTIHDLGDEDWVQFYANEGTILTMQTANLGDDADTEIELYADGSFVTPIVSDDNSGGNRASLINWPVPGGQSGYYFVRIANVAPWQTRFGAAADYEFQITRDSGGPNLNAEAGASLRSGTVGTALFLNGNQSTDGGGFPATFQWTILDSPGAPPSLNDSSAVLSNFTPLDAGIYVISLVVGDGVQFTDEDHVVIVVEAATDQVWVAFDATDTGTGTLTDPFHEVWRGADRVEDDGTISITTGETAEKPILGSAQKSYQLVAVGGPVRIGVAGAKKTLSAQSEPGDTKSDAANTIWATAAMGSAGIPVSGTSLDEEDDTAVRNTARYDQVIYEPVLPFTRRPDGLQAAQVDGPLAVRVRGNAALDPGSVWGPVPPGYDETGVVMEWRPVEQGNRHDIWVIAHPQEYWYLDDIVTMTAGATTADDESIETGSHRFIIESESEYEDRTNGTPDAIEQPIYDEDFDASEREPSAESNEEVTVAPATTTGEELGEGVDAPVLIGPERVFEVPQRVWLPLPQGVEPSTVRLYYYHATDSDKGWYPAENVQGWLVPNSYLNLRTDGVTYLGFLVRHAGIVQLGIPIEKMR